MFHVKHSTDDTIAAIATPVGVGGIAVVRLSGPDSRQIAARLFVSGKPLKSWSPRRLHHGWIEASGSMIDEVLLSFMPAPGSYTGEDVVEISCHGGGLVVKKILGLLVEQGARLAERGEFAMRAFLNGRMDLLKAEAVADLIGAKSERGLRAAAAQLGGSISVAVLGVRQALLNMASVIEASIDFPDDVEPPDRNALARHLTEQGAAADKLLATAEEGRLIREGVRLAIIGKPNVGKSSLLNRLMGADRAIVSEVPGTTRDTIEEGLVIDGLSFVVVDTAGLRQPNDMLEAKGVGRTTAEIAKADLVMVVLDASSELSTDDIQALTEGLRRRAVIVLNKIDLGESLSLNGQAKNASQFRVSALTGEGLGALRQGLVGAVLGSAGIAENESSALVNERHREALWRAKEAIAGAAEGLSANVPLDLITIDIKRAINALGEMAGQGVSDEIIENIFDRFCVGK